MRAFLEGFQDSVAQGASHIVVPIESPTGGEDGLNLFGEVEWGIWVSVDVNMSAKIDPTNGGLHANFYAVGLAPNDPSREIGDSDLGFLNPLYQFRSVLSRLEQFTSRHPKIVAGSVLKGF